MIDWRIRYLKFLEGGALAISFVATAVLIAVAIPGLVLETENYCVPRLRLWLIGIVARSFLRFLIVWQLYRVLAEPEPSFQSFRACHIWLETLDVIGAVWFILLNVIVLDNISCMIHSPLIYSACVIYIVAAYMYFSLFYGVVISLLRWPPASPEDSRYLHDRHQASAARFNAQNAPGTIQSEHSAVPSAEWAKWLETYGCHQVLYSKEMRLSQICGKDSRRSSSTAETDRSLSEGSAELGSDIESGPQGSSSTSGVILEQNYGATEVDIDYCTICLLPFEAPPASESTNPIISSDNAHMVGAATNTSDENSAVIVRYPCRANHYFHAHCLHRWLEVSSVAHATSYRIMMTAAGGGDLRKLVTCPICREHPSLPKTSDECG